jgi:NADH-quinone oxidoreductase subunit C
MMTASALARVLDKAGCSCREIETPHPGIDCLLEVEADALVSLVRIVSRNGFFLESISAVDRLKEEKMEGVYIFNLYEECQRLLIRIVMHRSSPVLPSISRIFPGALWYERELIEMFGIRFDGCPDTRNLLLPEEADYHPLRKDFQGVER